MTEFGRRLIRVIGWLVPLVLVVVMVVVADRLTTAVETLWSGTCGPGQTAPESGCTEGLGTFLHAVAVSWEMAREAPDAEPQPRVDLEQSLKRLDEAVERLEKLRVGLGSLADIKVSYAEPYVMRTEQVEVDAILFETKKVNLPVVGIREGQLTVGEALAQPIGDIHDALGVTLGSVKEVAQVLQEMEARRAPVSGTETWEDRLAGIGMNLLSLQQELAGLLSLALWAGVGLLAWLAFTGVMCWRGHRASPG